MVVAISHKLMETRLFKSVACVRRPRAVMEQARNHGRLGGACTLIERNILTSVCHAEDYDLEHELPALVLSTVDRYHFATKFGGNQFYNLKMDRSHSIRMKSVKSQ
jgi:hypothetical protein